jgi:tRNA/tmRNA/rRNA uracil-C5-methylase (TrmA/RlmC/RlmD family)
VTRPSAAETSATDPSAAGAAAARPEAPDAVDSWLDRVLECEVGPVAHGGHCVARVDGRVVFVRHALPGERVRAVVTEDRHGPFCRADAIAVLSPSPDRVEAPCVWARAGGCGGCDFQHATPEAQRGLKADVLAEQLHRLAGVDRPVEVEELPGGALGWRHRMRLAVGPDGRAGLRAHRAHDVIPIADCPLAAPGMLPDVLERTWTPGGEVQVERDSTDEVWVSWDGPAVREGSRSSGGVPVLRRAAGYEWQVPAGAFWQVHPALADILCAVVADWAQAPVGGRAWDLYGGVGVLATVLAGQVGPTGTVTVVESDRAAVAAGHAALADVAAVRWRTGRVERELAGLTAEGRPDVVVADPPRKGLGRAVVEGLAAAGPDRLVHVACDPAALARDVALLAERGYQLAELRAFDAFPMTHHLEAVALFRR